MQIKGKATPSQREKLRELIRKESTYEIPEELVERLINMGLIIRLRSGEAITRAGDIDPDFYILIDGIMRCYHVEGEAETERTSYFGLPGTVCISYHSYLRGQPSPNTYEVCCPSTLMKVRKEDFSSLIDSSAEFARWCLGNVQYQLYFFEMKGRTVQGPAKERYETILKKRPEIIHNVSLRIIASYLGITPQYLSKLRRQIQ